MSRKQEESPLVRGDSVIDLLRENGVDVDPTSEGSRVKEFTIETAKKIRAMREGAGLTQAALARLSGMSQADVSRIESGLGTKGPSLETINRLASACNRECNVEFSEPGERRPQLTAEPALNPRSPYARKIIRLIARQMAEMGKPDVRRRGSLRAVRKIRSTSGSALGGRKPETTLIDVKVSQGGRVKEVRVVIDEEPVRGVIEVRNKQPRKPSPWKPS